MNRHSLKKCNQKCWLVAWSILLSFFFSPPSGAASGFTWREETCAVRGLVDADAETEDIQMYLYVEERLIMAERVGIGEKQLIRHEEEKRNSKKEETDIM